MLGTLLGRGTANTDTVPSAVFTPSLQRFFINDAEKLRIDDTGMLLDGEPVPTFGPTGFLREGTWGVNPPEGAINPSDAPVEARYWRMGSLVTVNWACTIIGLSGGSATDTAVGQEFSLSDLPFAVGDVLASGFSQSMAGQFQVSGQINPGANYANGFVWVRNDGLSQIDLTRRAFFVITEQTGAIPYLDAQITATFAYHTDAA